LYSFVVMMFKIFYFLAIFIFNFNFLKQVTNAFSKFIQIVFLVSKSKLSLYIKAIFSQPKFLSF
jgi:hypothetical protein